MPRLGSIPTVRGGPQQPSLVVPSRPTLDLSKPRLSAEHLLHHQVSQQQQQQRKDQEQEEDEDGHPHFFDSANHDDSDRALEKRKRLDRLVAKKAKLMLRTAIHKKREQQQQQKRLLQQEADAAEAGAPGLASPTMRKKKKPMVSSTSTLDSPFSDARRRRRRRNNSNNNKMQQRKCNRGRVLFTAGEEEGEDEVNSCHQEQKKSGRIARKPRAATTASIVEFDCTGVIFQTTADTVAPILNQIQQSDEKFLELPPTPSSASSTQTRRFFVNRDPEAFGLLLLALRRARRIAEMTQQEQQHQHEQQNEGIDVATGLPHFPQHPHRQQASRTSHGNAVSSFDASNHSNPRLARFPAHSEAVLFEEASFFGCVPSIWQSLSTVRFSAAPRPYNNNNNSEHNRGGLTPFTHIAHLDDGLSLSSSTICALASPFVGPSGSNVVQGGAAAGDTAASSCSASVVEVAFKIEVADYIGIGCVTRAVAQSGMDREFYNQPGCCVLYMSGVVHANYFGRYRRFDTDASYDAGDTVSVRIDHTANVIQWRRNGYLILTERFASPPEFLVDHGASVPSLHPGELAVACVLRRGTKLKKVFLQVN